MVRYGLLLALGLASAAAGLPSPSAVLGGDATACTSGEGPAILANVTGLKDRAGELKLELYPATTQDFLKDDRDLIAEGKVFRRVRVAPPASGPIALCIRAPRVGEYALLFTHNRDSRNKFNFWIDGAGIPSNTKLGRAKPQVGEATIAVGQGVTVTNIRAQYLRGLSGFSPRGN